MDGRLETDDPTGRHASSRVVPNTGATDPVSVNEPQPAAPQPGLVAWFRRGWRGGWVSVATVTLATAWFVGLPFTIGSASRRRRWRRGVFGTWSRALLSICHVHVEVRGALPVEPCFLVANHLGYVDILVLAARVDATFVSMKELEAWPVFGTMARQFGTVFIDRSRKRDIPDVNAAMERALSQCSAVVVFPEGRHTRGATVLPFRPSLLEPAARGGHPVAWAVLHYATGERDPSAASAIPWVDVPFTRQVLVLLALDRVEATLEFGPDVVRGDDRKQLAEALHARVRSRFRPLPGTTGA